MNKKEWISITEKKTLPLPDTRAYQLLALTGVCGEFPAGLLSRIEGGEQYWEKVVTTLKKEKLLRTYYRDHLRGYRLGRRAKTLLLCEQPERFSFFLTGSTDTNLLKSEVTRRLRLHRIAATTVMMQNAGVRIFRDEKPDVFSPDGFGIDPAAFFDSSAFYSSREVKALGLDTVKIGGSRMTGVLLAQSGIFPTYAVGSSPPEWDLRIELRTKALFSTVICGKQLAGQYAANAVQGLLLCDGMGALVQILSEANTAKRCFFLLDNHYEHFYYLTNDRYGDALLRLLCDSGRQATFHHMLFSELTPPSRGLPVEYDAVDRSGRPVLFAYLSDIPRLGRFLAGLSLHRLQGCIVCFDFQAQALKDCCGENIAFLPIDFERFETEFCP